MESVKQTLNVPSQTGLAEKVIKQLDMQRKDLANWRNGKRKKVRSTLQGTPKLGS